MRQRLLALSQGCSLTSVSGGGKGEGHLLCPLYLPSVELVLATGIEGGSAALTASQPVALALGFWIQPHQPPGPGPEALGPAPGGLGASEPAPLAVAELSRPGPCPMPPM